MCVFIESAIVEVRRAVSVSYNPVLFGRKCTCRLVDRQSMLLALKTYSKYQPLGSKEHMKSLELGTVRVFYVVSYWLRSVVLTISSICIPSSAP